MTEQTGGAGAGAQPTLQLTVDRGLRRNRLTSFFRLILVIPHLVVLVGLAVALAVITIVNWFAALVRGRVPDGLHAFAAGVIAWQGRVSAYLYLLTDSYPPFALQRIPPYPVRVTVPRGGPLNRVAVLFRIVLALPAYVVSILLGGVQVFVIFAWFAAVFAGRTPRAVHDAIATVVRYQLRFLAYATLLTPTYPWGPLGDGVERGPGYATGPSPAYPPVAAPPGYGPPPAAPGDPAQPVPATQPVPGAAADLPPMPPGYPAARPGYPPMPPAAESPALGPYTGSVSSGARAILIVSLVLGAAQGAGQAVSYGRGEGGFRVPHFADVSRVTSAQDDFRDATGGTIAVCADEPTDCQRAVAASLADASERFGAAVETVHPSGSRDRLLGDLATFRADVAAADPLVDSVGGVADQRVLDDEDRIDDDTQKLLRALA